MNIGHLIVTTALRESLPEDPLEREQILKALYKKAVWSTVILMFSGLTFFVIWNFSQDSPEVRGRKYAEELFKSTPNICKSGTFKYQIKMDEETAQTTGKRIFELCTEQND